MIEEFVKRWDARKGEVEERFRSAHPKDYSAIVEAIIKILHDEDDYSSPDPTRITEIDHGSYQGTLLYVIAESNYQPSRYWYVYVSYGSCSGCDTLQAISGYNGDPPTDEQVAQYMTLALHIVQGLKEMEE